MAAGAQLRPFPQAALGASCNEMQKAHEEYGCADPAYGEIFRDMAAYE